MKKKITTSPTLQKISESRLGKYLQTHQRAALIVTAVLFLIGVVARYSLAWRGYNFDFESWLMIGNIVKDGGNVYFETWRYPYGPVWATILGLLRHVSMLFSSPDIAFRYIVITFLVLVDVGIWAILKKYFGTFIAFVFFLSPISIIITGYHNQIDAMAVFIALLAVIVYGKEAKQLTKKHILGLFILGLSLATKHLFFMFSIWLAIRQEGWRQKCIVAAVPVLVFGLSFLPFWSLGGDDIVNNVFLYKSFNNAPLWYAIVPKFLQGILTPSVLFYGTLLIFGFITRKKSLLEAALIYTLVLVIFSSAVANQYFVTVMPAVAVFYNHLFGVYLLYTTLFLFISPAALHISRIVNNMPAVVIEPINKDHIRTYDVLIPLLALGFLWIYQSKAITRFAKVISTWSKKEYKEQVKLLKS